MKFELELLSVWLKSTSPTKGGSESSRSQTPVTGMLWIVFNYGGVIKIAFLDSDAVPQFFSQKKLTEKRGECKN